MIEGIKYKLRSLRLSFDRAVLKASIKLDDLYYDFIDPIVEKCEKIPYKLKGTEPDGSIKIGENTYLYPPEPTKEKGPHQNDAGPVIDAEFTDIPKP